MKSIDTNHQFVSRFCRSSGRLDLFRHGPLEVVKSGGRHSTNSTQGNSKKKKIIKKKKKKGQCQSNPVVRRIISTRNHLSIYQSLSH